ncbi:hypothetical protein TNCT_609781 [Trichonephila clavata]|uniref:Uncharacterized protein n=1 Tax=Trichonephila clavata TaxID=2740835 RepID=A0A8X6FQF8_TRICU|nr:hypothetical protein TNCT_609781 [Trichonephila clavata]
MDALYGKRKELFTIEHFTSNYDHYTLECFGTNPWKIFEEISPHLRASSSIVPQSATQKFNATASITPTGKLRKPKREKPSRPSPGIREKSGAPSSRLGRTHIFLACNLFLRTGKLNNTIMISLQDGSWLKTGLEPTILTATIYEDRNHRVTAFLIENTEFLTSIRMTR